MTGYVDTWKGIASAIGRSERWCRYMAQRIDDPLPAYKVGGIVRVDMPELESWMARQQARPVVRYLPHKRAYVVKHLALIA